MPYKEDEFNFLYSISVFTHLPEDMQFAWLGELARIAKMNAVLLLSIHNMDLLPEKAVVPGDTSGFRYVNLGLTDGLPNFYQTAYHTHQYVMEHWERYFEVLSVIPKAVAGHQDLVVCRRQG